MMPLMGFISESDLIFDGKSLPGAALQAVSILVGIALALLRG